MNASEANALAVLRQQLTVPVCRAVSRLSEVGIQKMITENLSCTDFESSKHLIYGKALLDFAKSAEKEYAATQGDGHALLRFIENSKIEVNGKVFQSKLLWYLLVDCYEPVPDQFKKRYSAILDFSDCHTYRDVCLRFEHSYFQIYQASQNTMLVAEACG